MIVCGRTRTILGGVAIGPDEDGTEVEEDVMPDVRVTIYEVIVTVTGRSRGRKGWFCCHSVCILGEVG